VAFERFDAANAKSGPPTIGIQKGGSFSLNHAAWLLLGSPARVFLYYDRDAQAIAFSQAPDDQPSAFKVRSNSGHESEYSTRYVSGNSFLSYYDLWRYAATRVPARKNDDDFLVGELSEAAPTGGSAKAKAKKPEQGRYKGEKVLGDAALVHHGNRADSEPALVGQSGERYCAMGSRCVSFDPTDPQPMPAKLYSNNQGTMCTKCRRRSGVE
jgi:hypothetical protein